jgi:hypothetical protein
MKLECSFDLTDCTCTRNFCRKSVRIHPHSDNLSISYRQTQVVSVSKHSDKNGACLLIIMLCVATCCIFLPICGLWIGPLIYYIQLASGDLPPTTVPTMTPTMIPTLVPPAHIIKLLNDTFNNVTNITI